MKPTGVVKSLLLCHYRGSCGLAHSYKIPSSDKVVMNASLSAKGRGVKCLRSSPVRFVGVFVFEQDHSTRYSAIKSTKLVLSKCLKGQNKKGGG